MYFLLAVVGIVMTAGQNDNDRLTRELGRPIQAVISAAERLVTGTTPSNQAEDGRGSAAGGDDVDARPTDRRNGRDTEQLVPPRERIIGLIERNGGRMKQGEIVEAVEWSESTVSRKLGTLESAGAITRYRIGRGKIVFLPGAEPDCVGPALDSEDEERTLAA